MTNLTQVAPAFSVDHTSIRSMGDLYSLNDLHKAGGGEDRHLPNRFMRLEQTKALITEIEQTPDLALAYKAIHGGKNPGTYACKELCLAYAAWVKPQLHLHLLRTFLNGANPAPQKALPRQPLPIALDILQEGGEYMAVTYNARHLYHVLDRAGEGVAAEIVDRLYRMTTKLWTRCDEARLHMHGLEQRIANVRQCLGKQEEHVPVAGELRRWL